MDTKFRKQLQQYHKGGPNCTFICFVDSTAIITSTPEFLLPKHVQKYSISVVLKVHNRDNDMFLSSNSESTFVT